MRYLLFDWIKYLVCQEIKDLNSELLMILFVLVWLNVLFWFVFSHYAESIQDFEVRVPAWRPARGQEASAWPRPALWAWGCTADLELSAWPWSWKTQTRVVKLKKAETFSGRLLLGHYYRVKFAPLVAAAQWYGLTAVLSLQHQQNRQKLLLEVPGTNFLLFNL